MDFEIKELGEIFDNIMKISVLQELEGYTPIPRDKGVYIIWRESDILPDKFILNCPVRIYKGKALSYSGEKLNEKWVTNANVVYIGSAIKSLHERLTNYFEFGKGKDKPHRGGRAIWQLKDYQELMVAWKCVENPKKIECDLIAKFKRTYGKIPFANWQEPKSHLHKISGPMFSGNTILCK